MDTSVSSLLTTPTDTAASAVASASALKPAARSTTPTAQPSPFARALKAAGALAKSEAGSTEVLDLLADPRTDLRADTSGDPLADGASAALALASAPPDAPLQPVPPPPPLPPAPEPSSTSLMQWVMQLSAPPESVAGAATGRADALPSSAATAERVSTSALPPALSADTSVPADSPRRPIVAETPMGPTPFTLPSDAPRAVPGDHAGSAGDGNAASMTALPFSAAAVAAAAATTAPSTGVVTAQGSPVVAPAQTWIQTPVTQPGFSDAVVVELVRRIGQAEQGPQSVTLHLNPESLGPVSVSIELQGSDARIAFGASEALTRHHLEAALPILEQTLREGGVCLTHGAVHAASKEALAASASAGMGAGGEGAQAQARSGASFDQRSESGNRPPSRGETVFSVNGRAVVRGHAPVVLGPSPGRAGRLDLVV